jgi:ABC-type multidrug transport system fused ATPase/permease subunit
MDRQNPGELATRITSDASTIRLIAVSFMTQLVTGLVSITGALMAMAALNVFLLAVTLCTAFLPGSLLLLTIPKVRTWSKRTQVALGGLGKDLERVLGNFTMVKASGAEAQEAEVISARIATTEQMGRRVGIWRSVSSALSQTTMQVSYIAVLATGGILVHQGRMDVASLVTFLMYASQLSAPIIGLTTAASAFQSGYASLERTAEVEDMSREANTGALQIEGTKMQEVPLHDRAPGSQPATTPLDPGRFTIQFEDVQFAYPGQRHRVLRGLHLDLPDRGLTALVGPSGCGKSTILRLACGFYPISAGGLSIAGRPIEQWDLQDLRASIAFVAQDAPVLEGTLRDNLLYGHMDGTVDEDDMRAALEIVALDDVFSDLDMAVGYRGQSLSGGQRQRVAIARGLLRSPKMLLLDESTSALDTTTEQKVIRRLRGIADSLGVVMVAHRLATVVDADEIVVLDRGLVRNRGTHAELLERDDLYRQLVADGQRAEIARKPKAASPHPSLATTASAPMDGDSP